MREMRGSAPAAPCLAEWSRRPTEAPAVETSPTAESEEVDYSPFLQESFAAALAFAALALSA
jgi:hypothetical protein